jgi:hypothetical protein
MSVPHHSRLGRPRLYLSRSRPGVQQFSPPNAVENAAGVSVPPTGKFLYTCGVIDLWEWEFRLLDRAAAADGDDAPICLGGRGAAPPEHCGGPTGYRLMLKRQKEGQSMCTPVQVEAMIGMLSAAHPDQSTNTWDLLRGMLDDGFQSIDRRLEQYGPLQPDRFSLQEANQRLAKLTERGRFHA